MTVISESGLFAAIIRSDKANARQFRKWVTSEVLPTIRRQGYYALPGTVVGILPPSLFRKRLHGKPACLGSSLWACLGIRMRLTDWLPLRLAQFTKGLDFEWLTDGGDALITRGAAEEIAARAWSNGARKLRYAWAESVSTNEGETLGGAA